MLVTHPCFLYHRFTLKKPLDVYLPKMFSPRIPFRHFLLPSRTGATKNDSLLLFFSHVFKHRFRRYVVLSSDGPGIRRVLGAPGGDDGTAGADPGAAPTLTPGTCLRVNTGAPVPETPAGDVAVLQVEDTRLAEASEDGSRELRVEMLKASAPGQDIRRVGSDIAAGEKVLAAGTVLRAAELGLLATVGCTRVT